MRRLRHPAKARGELPVRGGWKSLCEDSMPADAQSEFGPELMSLLPSFLLPAAEAGRLAEAPHPRQVIGGGAQCPLHGDFLQSAHAKPPHASLFFQDSVDWFDDRFAPRINDASCRIPQFPSHAPLRRMHGSCFNPTTAI